MELGTTDQLNTSFGNMRLEKEQEPQDVSFGDQSFQHPPPSRSNLDVSFGQNSQNEELNLSFGNKSQALSFINPTEMDTTCPRTLRKCVSELTRKRNKTLNVLSLNHAVRVVERLGTLLERLVFAPSAYFFTKLKWVCGERRILEI